MTRWRAVVAIVGAALVLAGCGGVSSSPSAVAGKFVEAVQSGDVQTAENLMVSQLRQAFSIFGSGQFELLQKQFPSGVPYKVVEERIVGETAYVEVRMLYTPRQLRELRKPYWQSSWEPEDPADQSLFGEVSYGLGLTLMPRFEEVLNGPVPEEVLTRWLASPPEVSYRDALSELKPIILEARKLGFEPIFQREKKEEWEARVSALRAKVRQILNEHVIPAATYTRIAKWYVLDKKAQAYSERHRVILGREEGRWLVRELSMLDSSGKEI